MNKNKIVVYGIFVFVVCVCIFVVHVNYQQSLSNEYITQEHTFIKQYLGTGQYGSYNAVTTDILYIKTKNNADNAGHTMCFYFVDDLLDINPGEIVTVKYQLQHNGKIGRVDSITGKNDSIINQV